MEVGNDATSKISTEGKNTLVVPNMGIEDAGLYVCIAQNSLGSARDRTYVQVQLQSKLSFMISL